MPVIAVLPLHQPRPVQVTCAVLVKVPKRPTTKPLIAIAAMRVMAMSITVARTGEVSFLDRVGTLMLVHLLEVARDWNRPAGAH